MSNGSVEIIYGGTDRPHRVIGDVKANKGARFVWSPYPEIAEGEEALRKKAAKMGADAVINTQFDRGISVWSWKAVKGRGTAIAFEDGGAAPVASG